MAPPFYPFDAGEPEPLDSLEPDDHVAFRESAPGRGKHGDGEASGPAEEDDALVLSSDFSTIGHDRALIETAW